MKAKNISVTIIFKELYRRKYQLNNIKRPPDDSSCSHHHRSFLGWWWRQRGSEGDPFTHTMKHTQSTTKPVTEPEELEQIKARWWSGFFLLLPCANKSSPRTWLVPLHPTSFYSWSPLIRLTGPGPPLCFEQWTRVAGPDPDWGLAAGSR